MMNKSNIEVEGYINLNLIRTYHEAPALPMHKEIEKGDNMLKIK